MISPSRAFFGQFLVGEFEALLALSLFAGIWASLVRKVAMATFGVFASVALYKAATGAESCGCAGSIIVPPLYAVWLDVTVAALLFANVPDPTVRRGRLRALCRGAAVVSIAAFVMTPVCLHFARAWELRDRNKTPRLVAIDRPEIDLGVVDRDAVVGVEFHLRNLSAETRLDILSLRPDCGCITPGLWGGEIHPDGELCVPITFRASAVQGGSFRRGLHVAVSSDDGSSTNEVYLAVVGEVDQSRLVAVTPGAVDFGEVGGDTVARRTVRLKGVDRQIHVRQREATVRHGTSAVVDVDLAPGSARAVQEVDLLLDAATWPPGQVNTSVEFKTAGPRAIRIVVPITAYITGPIVATPRRLLLAAERATSPTTLRLRARSGARLEIAAIHSVPRVPVTVVATAGSEAEIVCRWDGAPPEAIAEGEIVVETLSPRAATRVPYVVAPATR